jgi:hypothetical protein
MNLTRILPSVTLLVVLAADVAPAQVRQAEFKIHDRGSLWETMKDDGTVGAPNPTNRFQFFPSMDWPGGPHVLPSKDEQRSYSVGSGLWIGGKRANGTIFFTEHGPFANVDRGTFEEITRQNNFLGRPGFNPAEAEQKITAAFTTTENIHVRRTSRQWSFRGLNETILIEFVVTNRSAGVMDDVFIGLPYLLRPSYQDFVVHNGWGDDLNRVDDLVRYDASRRLVYSFDDTPNFSLPWDVGNYWDEANELRTTGYAGFALLHADPNRDGSSEPANVLYAQLLNNERYLTLISTSREALYSIMTGEDRSLQASPEERLAPFILMSIGPYRLEPNGSARFVIAHSVNGLPLSEAVKGLSVQERLPAGLDSLRKSIDRARVLFNENYQVRAVPPPSPEVTILPLPAARTISLSWAPLETSWTNPLPGGGNFTEYRVYRAERGFTGPYRQVARVRPNSTVDRTRFWDEARGVWHFIDNNVTVGTSYFYAVTSVDSRGHESWLTNRNEVPVRVASEPAGDALNVRVFPNPFRMVSGFPTRGEENTIVWTNLPARATIRIYGLSGELIRTIEHDNPNAGEAVWDQLTDSRQRTAPGAYVWTVQSDVGNARGTLLLIK